MLNMATIRFKNNTAKHVSYDTAARVYQVLIGNEKPKDEVQAAFIRTVEAVEFPATNIGRQPASSHMPSHETIIERRKRIQQIRMDPTLHGKDKYYAIGEVLYGRNLQPRQRQQRLV
jgi:hypothetical protein